MDAPSVTGESARLTRVLSAVRVCSVEPWKSSLPEELEAVATKDRGLFLGQEGHPARPEALRAAGEADVAEERRRAAIRLAREDVDADAGDVLEGEAEAGDVSGPNGAARALGGGEQVAGADGERGGNGRVLGRRALAAQTQPEEGQQQEAKGHLAHAGGGG